MKKFSKYNFITDGELNKREIAAYDDGCKKQKALNKKKINDLEDLVQIKNDELKSLERKNRSLKEYVSALEEERDDGKKIAIQKIKNEDQVALIEEKLESLEKYKKHLQEKEDSINDAKNSKYQEGYADGVSDGVRKINEITRQDRDNAMKVAMVAASSHTPVENLKELNSVHQLTSGNQNEEKGKSS